MKSLDLGHWNTSNVNSMYQCFKGCSSLLYLNIEDWTLNDGVIMDGLFDDCNRLIMIRCSENVYHRLFPKRSKWEYEGGFALKTDKGEWYI